ncbi:MAG: homocysteine S-methyltransferase family protein [Hyphomicrobiales bacterium]
MAKYRHGLPQLTGELFLTDGGIETCLIFHDGLDLPDFAAFDLFKDGAGRAALDRYYRNYISIAQNNSVGFILESATWRASPDWGSKLGYSSAALAEMNRTAVALLHDLRGEYETADTKVVVSGCVGPRGDGYDPDEIMTEDEAERYHAFQVGAFKQAEADMVTAITMTHVEEAVGITRAAQAADMPAVISFTVETDGRLPTGQTLKDAIEQVDAATGGGPAYFMINCAHPTHFNGALAKGETWIERIRGIRANASTMSHAELDEAEELDDGNPGELGGQYRALRDRMSHINVLGGCCGTDHRHVEAICHACAA